MPPRGADTAALASAALAAGVSRPVHVLRPVADCPCMSVSGVSGSSAPVPTEADRAIAVMKRAKDASEVQAEGLVKLVEQAGQVGRNLSVYA